MADKHNNRLIIMLLCIILFLNYNEKRTINYDDMGVDQYGCLTFQIQPFAG